MHACIHEDTLTGGQTREITYSGHHVIIKLEPLQKKQEQQIRDGKASDNGPTSMSLPLPNPHSPLFQGSLLPPTWPAVPSPPPSTRTPSPSTPPSRSPNAKSHTHLPLPLRVDVDHIMAAVVVPTVNQHCQQDVLSWGGLRSFQEFVQVHPLWKRIPVENGKTVEGKGIIKRTLVLSCANKTSNKGYPTINYVGGAKVY